MKTKTPEKPTRWIDLPDGRQIQVSLTPMYRDGEVHRWRLVRGFTPDGKPKVFTYAPDVTEAIKAATRVVRIYEKITPGPDGRRVWEKQWTDLVELVEQKELSEAYSLAIQIQDKAKEALVAKRALDAARGRYEKYVGTPATAKKTTTPATVTTPSAAMLHAAVDDYVAAMKGKALRPSTTRRIGETLAALKHFREDVALSVIDRAWIEGLTDFIKSRPAKRGKGKGRLAPLTVKTHLQHWRQFFHWLDAQSESPKYGGWEAPKRMNELFAVDLTKLMTKKEKDTHADGPAQIKLDEIVKLYQACKTDAHKAWVLAGLFTAQGQTELSVSRRDEFDLDGERYVHRRNKTGVKGKYWLPPELVTLLRKLWRGDKKDDLAFRTAKGGELVTETSDAVRQAFDDWRQRAEITRPGVTFYSLRRKGGDLAKRVGGPALQQVWLSHADYAVGKHYSGFRPFAEVRRVGRKLYRLLVKQGLFAAPNEGSVEKEV
jgi:hypothetical protein